MASSIDDAAFVCTSGSVFKAFIKASLSDTTLDTLECNRSLNSMDDLLVKFTHAAR